MKTIVNYIQFYLGAILLFTGYGMYINCITLEFGVLLTILNMMTFVATLAIN